MKEVGRSIADDVIMAAIAILSVGLLVVENVVSADRLPLVYLVDGVIVVLMAGDWLFHLNRAPDKRRYLRQTALELPGLLPLVVLRWDLLRFLRLFRLLRAYRAYRQAQSEVEQITSSALATRVSSLTWAAGGATLLGSVLVWAVERAAGNPDFQQYPDALWWVVVTVTTVGYGDVVPTTSVGRVIAVLLIIVGIAALALLVSILSTTLVAQTEEEREEEVLEAASAASIADQLARLADLHDQEKITDDEFEAAKRLVLEP